MYVDLSIIALPVYIGRSRIGYAVTRHYNHNNARYDPLEPIGEDNYLKTGGGFQA